MEKQIIDLEEYSKAGKKVPKDAEYKFRVDKISVTVSDECLTGKEILEKAGYKPADNYLLREVLHGNQKVPIALDQTVCFTEPGIERFITIPKDPGDGAC
ncbi:MAG: multiubiquitin domain-containing protein [Ginsengibacter sp.]